MKLFKRYWTIWTITALNALQVAFVNRASNVLFFIGKTIRVSMSLLFLFLIRDQIAHFNQYTTDQVLIFYLTYQFIDTFSQIFYRGVYEFREKIRTGTFDFDLAKPISPLFRALTGQPDINDAFFFIPTTLVSIYIATTLQISVSLSSVLWYLVLLANAFLIATALHIIVLVVGVLTTEVEGVIWMYRDLMRLGRFPVSIYLEPMRLALFFIIPVGMMITIPAEVLLNLEPTYSAGLAIVIGVGILTASLWLWRWSLKHYSSASS